jgi:hypothetical protein
MFRQTAPAPLNNQYCYMSYEIYVPVPTELKPHDQYSEIPLPLRQLISTTFSVYRSPSDNCRPSSSSLTYESNAWM